ncbi:hypothetical protein KKC45_02510 [Patescibacteria group bacterium]|nr:hypothetical protein [Patescibacteria group bacterium]
MRNKLIKILRESEEKGDGYKNEYIDFFKGHRCNYSITEYLDFPNYRFVTKEYNNKYATRNRNGIISIISSRSIRAELKRMEFDSLVIIGIQEGISYATTTTASECPDFDEPTESTSESLVLTTKGKNEWEYFWHKITENPINIIISSVAIIISIIALFV